MDSWFRDLGVLEVALIPFVSPGEPICLVRTKQECYWLDSFVLKGFLGILALPLKQHYKTQFYLYFVEKYEKYASLGVLSVIWSVLVCEDSARPNKSAFLLVQQLYKPPSNQERGSTHSFFLKKFFDRIRIENNQSLFILHDHK
jgi:hypothetical protein